jgi:hypothetical protein
MKKKEKLKKMKRSLIMEMKSKVLKKRMKMNMLRMITQISMLSI